MKHETLIAVLFMPALLAAGCQKTGRAPAQPHQSTTAKTTDTGVEIETAISPSPVVDPSRDAGPITVDKEPKETSDKDPCERVRALNAATDTEQALHVLKTLHGEEFLEKVREEAKEIAEQSPEHRRAWDLTLTRMEMDPSEAAWASTNGSGDCDEETEATSVKADKALLVAEGGATVFKTDPYCHVSEKGAWTYLRQTIPCGSPKWRYSMTKLPSGEWTRFAELNVPTREREVIALVPSQGPVLFKYFESSEYIYEPKEVIHTFDFDDDGSKEAIWKAEFYNEGTTDLWIEVISVKDGRLELYPLGFNRSLLFDSKDMTGDGRPDLLLHQWACSTQCGSGFCYEVDNVTLLAESKEDGTFDLLGKNSTAHLKKQCPKKPRSFKTVTDVACARLWGLGTKVLIRKIRAQNDPYECDANYEENGEPPPPRVNEDYEAIMEATGFVYPVVLDKRGQLIKKE